MLGSGEPYWRTKLMMLRSDPGGFADLFPAVFGRIGLWAPTGGCRPWFNISAEAGPDALISALTYQNLLAVTACRAARTGTRVLISERTTVNEIANSVWARRRRSCCR